MVHGVSQQDYQRVGNELEEVASKNQELLKE